MLLARIFEHLPHGQVRVSYPHRNCVLLSMTDNQGNFTDATVPQAAQ
jgi:hypothetical protein